MATGKIVAIGTSKDRSHCEHDRRLGELARAYFSLKSSLEDLAERDGQIQQEHRWTIQQENDYQAKVDPIATRMYDIAWGMVDIRANCLTGAHAKSQVLLDWCDPKGELKDALATSLCSDIQTMMDARQR
ncbi:MAG: hypothetical protein HC869_07960 [Rhodospirillales bacterium]|nr:hypothetical protein [Rhodospirillales bacterium]